MPTVAVNLDETQYVQVNTALNPIVLQSLLDSVRITISATKPALDNTVFHKLSGNDAPMHFPSLDTNVWVLSVSDNSSLIVSETSLVINDDFFHAVAVGNVAGHSLIHKFGKLAGITTNYSPLAHGGIYPTPKSDAPVNVRIKAGGNIQDAQNGTGARSVYVEGITTDGTVATEIILPHATNGTLAGVNGTVDFIRIYRCYVETSGSHANPSVGSHLAKIIIEDTGGVEEWAHIDGAIAAGDFPRGQSQIGVYTVPLGFTAYVYSYVLTTDGNKPIDFIFYQRGGILETATPYSGVMKAIVEPVGVTGEQTGNFKGGQKFSELTDIGWMAKGASTPTATVDFEIVLVAN